MFSESDINRRRKSEVNIQFTDFIKEYLNQSEKSYVHVPCHANIEQTAKYKWFYLKFKSGLIPQHGVETQQLLLNLPAWVRSLFN